MHVDKLRIRDKDGLVPAGHYFARLAANLREQNEREAAGVSCGEQHERKIENRYRRRARVENGQPDIRVS